MGDRRRAERYEAFIENCSEAFWCVEMMEPIPLDLPVEAIIDLVYERGRLADANELMARMYGFGSVEPLLGAPLEQLLPREPGNEQMIRAFVASGCRLTDVATKERDVEGRTKHFLNNMRGIVEGGRLLRVWGTQRDITEQRNLEEQFRQAQKMEAIGRLAGSVAHDFNNVLSVIMTFADLLREGNVSAQEMREGLEQIRQAALCGAGVTRPLLAFSRQKVVSVQRLDLNEVVTSLEKMLHRLVGEDVEIVGRLAPRLLPIQADRGSLEQILLNLIVNARDAMPTGGTLTIETANVDLDESYASSHFGSTPGPHVMLAVSDTGAGMDDTTQARMFEPFFTTKPVGKGTGLGLSIVYGTVKQCMGNVFVYSELGRGTSVKIYLPADLSSREIAARLPTRPPSLVTGDQVVLLVDDDALVRGAARAILDRLGYKVLEASHPEHAVEIGAAREAGIDLLLTDVVMPRLSGRELASRIGAMHPEMRVLYMSGYTDDSAIRHGVQVGEVAYLQKPFTPDSLARMVREVLSGSA